MTDASQHNDLIKAFTNAASILELSQEQQYAVLGLEAKTDPIETPAWQLTKAENGEARERAQAVISIASDMEALVAAHTPPAHEPTATITSFVNTLFDGKDSMVKSLSGADYKSQQRAVANIAKGARPLIQN